MLSHHSLQRQFDRPGLRSVAASATNTPVSANAQLSYPSLHSSSHGPSQQYHLTQQQSGFAQEAMSSRPLYRGHSSPSLLPTPSQHSYQENLLRRKTPQGTLAAAYDATPIEWTARPTKQILLPVPPSNEQDVQLDQGPRWQDVSIQGNQSWEGTLALKGADINMGSGCVNPAMWSTNSSSQLLANDGLEPYVRDFLLQQGQMIPPAADNLYNGGKPYGFQPLYNPITPPTASCEDINGFMDVGHYNDVPRDSNFYGHYGAWGNGSTTSNELPQASVYQMNSMYTPPSQQQLDNANIWQHQIPAVDSVQVSTFTQHMGPPYTLAPPPAGSPEAQLQHLQLDPQSHCILTPNRVNPHFRDTVLAWAHGVYVDLLSSVQAQHRQVEGRAQAGDRSRTQNGSTKPGLYPRPPIQPQISGWRSNGFRPQPSNGQTSTQYVAPGRLVLNREGGDRSKRMRPSPGQDQRHPQIATSSSHSQSLFTNSDGYRFLRNDGVMIHDGNDDACDNGNTESWSGGDQYPEKKQPLDCYSASPLHRPASGVGDYGPFSVNISHHGFGYLQNQQPSTPTASANMALEMLNGLCVDSGWTWLDGMLLGGCLAYVCAHSITL